MVEEVLEWLNPTPGGVWVDATVGSGGHAERIAGRIGPGGRLIGLDVDPEAISLCRERSKSWKCRTDLIQSGYEDLSAVLDDLEVHKANGILVDLGVSSIHIDRAERGFSFRKDGPLDMRMDPGKSPDASRWLAEASEAEIRQALWRYGEERRAQAIARAVVRERAIQPIRTTARLAEIVLTCFPDRERAGRVHPATRTFQALRLVVNQELEQLERLLSFLPARLNTGGRAVFLAYHSLEDRLVKKALHRWSGKDDPVYRRLPVRGEIVGAMAVLTRKVVRPSGSEVVRNPRARSARLRAAERTECKFTPTRH
jgi:16S rRNA (cytosine1402-N4)-methyltransferase